MATTTLLRIDGSTLEGGGQLIRNACAFATLLRKPVQLFNVRHNRSSPGLKAQHAAGLNLLREVCSADSPTVQKGMDSFIFAPRSIKSGEYTADPGTAGSTTLLLQISLPCLLFPSAHPEGPLPPSKLILRGGTNADLAPQIDYTRFILLPFLHRHFGISTNDLSLDIIRRGYYPYGGGQVNVTLSSSPRTTPLPPINLTSRGALTSVHGLVYASGPLPKEVANKMQNAATTLLVQNDVPKENIQFEVMHTPRDKAASGIVLWAETENGCILGGSAIGRKGKQAPDVGKAAAEELLRSLKTNACVDEHLQDQIIIFMSLADGKSTVRSGPLTLHTKTAIWIAETLTDAKFDITEEENGSTLINCTGIGYTSLEDVDHSKDSQQTAEGPRTSGVPVTI